MIVIQEKPVAVPKGPCQLLELVPYRVVEVQDKEKASVEVDDIVLRFPSGGANAVLNVTKQKMLWDRSSGDSWNQPFKCLRAHHIKSIGFAVDNDERPED